MTRFYKFEYESFCKKEKIKGSILYFDIGLLSGAFWEVIERGLLFEDHRFGSK